jgi:hypothetical protein
MKNVNDSPHLSKSLLDVNEDEDEDEDEGGVGEGGKDTDTTRSTRSPLHDPLDVNEDESNREITTVRSGMSTPMKYALVRCI